MKLQEILKNETPFIIQCEVGAGLYNNIIDAIRAKFEGNKDIVELRLGMFYADKYLKIDANTFYIFDEIDRATTEVLSFINENAIYKNFIGISHNTDFKMLGIPIYHYGIDDIFAAEFSTIFSPKFAESCEKFFGGGSKLIKEVDTRSESIGWEDYGIGHIIKPIKSEESLESVTEHIAVEEKSNTEHDNLENNVTISDVNAEDILGYPYIIKDNILNDGAYARKMLKQIRDGLKYIKENNLTFTSDEYLKNDFTNFLYFDKKEGIINKYRCDQGLFLREKGIQIITEALKEKLEVFIKQVVIDCEEIRNRDINDSKKTFTREVAILRKKLHKEIRTINNNIDVRKDVVSKMLNDNISLINNFDKQLDVEA
jgi:hypothetical protein